MSNPNLSLTRFLDILPKLTNYLVGLTLLCYLVGIMISNMYLGSLGIVNLDVLRTRYILVGLLFLLFISAIAYLIYGLFRTIRRDFSETSLKLAKNVFWYSFQNLSVLYFVVLALTVLSGSLNSLPIGLPKISPIVPWAEWLNIVPKRTVLLSILLLAVIFFSVFLVILIFIFINPKDKNGIKKPRSQQLREIFTGTKEEAKKTIYGILIIFCFIYIFLLIGNLLNFLSTNNIYGVSKTSGLFAGGWGRYLGGISLVYILITTYVMAIIMPNKTRKDDFDLLSSNPLTPISSKIYIVALAIIIIMPLYAYGIYPILPQQVGGGQVVRVEISTSDGDIKPLIIKRSTEIYMVDKANNNMLFLLIDKNTKKYQVVELPNDSISSIFYNIP